MYYGWDGMMNDGSWGGWLGFVFMLVFLFLIGLSVVALLRHLRGGGVGTSSKSARDLLNERYAKGEIDKKEYEEKKKDIAS